MGQGIPDWLVASTGLSSQHNMTVWKYLQVRAVHADTPVSRCCFKVRAALFICSCTSPNLSTSSFFFHLPRICYTNKRAFSWGTCTCTCASYTTLFFCSKPILILILCSSTPQSLPEQQGLFLEYLHMAKPLWKMARVYQQVRGTVWKCVNR